MFNFLKSKRASSVPVGMLNVATRGFILLVSANCTVLVLPGSNVMFKPSALKYFRLSSFDGSKPSVCRNNLKSKDRCGLSE